jgi:hypothetical protein
VHNRDNSRGGASFRLPVCDGARVENIGFRDIDQNPLNDWTSSVAGGEIVWQDAGSNALNWNTLYNFWFDCDVAPVSGDAVLDQARVGAGTLDVTVPTTVPGLQPSVWLGDGCGTPSIDLVVNDVPSAGNAGFASDLVGTAGAPALVFFAENTTALSLGSGCTFHLDLSAFGTVGLFVLDGAGEGAIPVPVPPGLMPADLYFQGATFPPSPPLFGFAGLTNGLLVRFANTGCQ